MKVLTAIVFALAAGFSGFLSELWHMHQDRTYSPELGLTFAAAGLAVLGLVSGLMFYGYGTVSRVLRKEEKIRAYAASSFSGVVYWFLLLGAHALLRDYAGAADAFWWIEAPIICGALFEVLRLIQRPSKKEPNQISQPTPYGVADR